MHITCHFSKLSGEAIHDWGLKHGGKRSAGKLTMPFGLYLNSKLNDVLPKSGQCHSGRHGQSPKSFPFLEK